MKLQDVKVGETYRFDPSNEWSTRKGHKAKDAKVLDTAMWIHEEGRYGFGYSSKPRPEPRLATDRDAKGKIGVLVEITEPTHKPGETCTYKTVVALRYLRGTVAEVEASHRKAEQVYRDEQARRQQRSDRREQVSASLAEIGVSRRYGTEGTIAMNVEELAAMVAALKATGWKYER